MNLFFQPNRPVNHSLIATALKTQATFGGTSIRLTNRCVAGTEPKCAPLNRNLRSKRIHFTEEQCASVRKLTGFAPFMEVGYV